jgi:transposase-like protein
VIKNGDQKSGEQEYKCNRCGARFNRRKGTPLEGLRTPSHIIGLAMFLYMCGVGVAMIAVATEKQEKTVERRIRRIVSHCKRLIEQNLSKHNHGFTSMYLQMDELWSYLWRKNTKVWIGAGLDVVARLFIAFHIGDRSGDSAKALVGTIKPRIDGVPGLITTDGHLYSGEILPIGHFHYLLIFRYVPQLSRNKQSNIFHAHRTHSTPFRRLFTI